MPQLEQEFNQLFNKKPLFKSVSRGRVNIIGEHTDYNNGYVLPVALQFATKVLACPRNDGIVNVVSKQYPNQKDSFDLNATIKQSQLQWANYVRGVVKELIDNGYTLGGADLLIDSQVPQGVGLSSSAALEVSIGGVFSALNGLSLSKQTIALIGQAAENNFIDCQCGIMDQLVCASSQAGHALMIDCLNLKTSAVAIPSELCILVINSNYPRKLADSEYNDRRAACELAASTMGVSSLRDANMHMLGKVKKSIDTNTFKRARHIITENQRVLDTLDALKNKDLNRFYDIMAEGQRSLEDDFEITVPATEGLVKMCLEASDGKAGVRQTGGGFGGAVVCVCSPSLVEKISSAINEKYPELFNLTADIYECHASEGLRISRL